MPLPSSTTSRNKAVTLRRPTVTNLLLRPVNLVVLAAGLAVGILLAALTTQPPLTVSAQTSLCGNDICEGPVEQNYNCSDCLPTCEGANWCVDGIGASPSGCPDYTEYDDWAYVPGVDYCSSAGCCVSVEGDDNPPVTTAILDGTRGLDDWFLSPVTVTLSVSDDWSGVFSTNLDGEPYTGPQVYDVEGATTIAYQSYDNAGNLEPLKTTTFYIDTVSPATTVVVPTNNSWVSGVVTIAGISTDATSGLAGVDISFDQGVTWLLATGGEVWAYPWDTRTLGVNIIQVRGRDQAGNIETPIVLAVSIDNSGPFFEVGPFPGEYCFTCSGPLTFTMTAFDEQSRINNSAIVVKQNGKDVRVLKAPAGELRNTPVVWDGRDSQGQLVTPGDYQLLFYTANYAGMFGSFGAGIRVTDVLPSVPPGAAPLVPADPPDDAPWIVTSNPPTPTAFIPASGITSGPVSIAPQGAAVPQTGAGGSISLLTGASGGLAGSQTGAAATGATALLLAAAAYIAAQQATGNMSLGKKLAELAGTWKPSAKPIAPPVGNVAPPQAPPPPPPRPRRLRWNEIPRVMPPPPPPKPVYYPAPMVAPVSSKSSPVRRLWPGRGGVLGAYGGGAVRRPPGQSIFSSAHASVTRSSNNSNEPWWQRVSAGYNAFLLGRNDFLEQAGVHYKPPQKLIRGLEAPPNFLMSTLASSSAPFIPGLPPVNPFRMGLDVRHGLAQTLRDPQTATQNWMNNQPRFIGGIPVGIPNPLYWIPRATQVGELIGSNIRNLKDGPSLSALAWSAASKYVTNKEKENMVNQLHRVEASNRYLNDTAPGYYDNRPDRYVQDLGTTFGIVLEAQMITTAVWGLARPVVLKNPQGFFGSSRPDIAGVKVNVSVTDKGLLNRLRTTNVKVPLTNGDSWNLVRGGELRFGENLRVAPFGNVPNATSPNPYSENPHYHLRGGIDPAKGVTREGQGLGRHRPNELSSKDQYVTDRFFDTTQLPKWLSELLKK